MIATENQFRGTAFGGFNRQDVLTYVQATVAAHTQQMEQLNKELKVVEEASAEQAALLAEAEIKVTHDTEENSRLSAELAAAQCELIEKTAALADVEHELAVLREKVRELEPGAEAYAHIKDRAASIELDAHLRAQMVLDDAEIHAKEVRAQTERWLNQVQSGYDRLRTDVDATISHASGELARVQKSFNSITLDFAAHDDVLNHLLDCCPQEKPHKVGE